MSASQSIITLLKTHYPNGIDLTSLAQLSDKSEQACMDLVLSLKKNGYPISLNNQSVSFTLPLIHPPVIEGKLKVAKLDNAIYFKDSLASTNTTALLNLDHFNSDTLVLTDHQTNGKGRLGRKWSDTLGKSVAFSLVLKPTIAHDQIPLFTQLAAAALCLTLSKFGDTKIKWPNDLILNGKKVAGILTESQFSGSNLIGVVIGIGINTNKAKDDFDSDLKKKATSLLIEYDKIIDPNALISDYSINFYRLYSDWIASSDSSPFIAICRSSSLLIGKEIKVSTNSEEERVALVKDINDYGELIIQYNDEAIPRTLRTLNYSIRGLNGYV
ncbi:biotin--[acetyl-CoA-carboxylase] ligase [Alkalibacterium sp. f15]|uniref:biotin--[acetyl-CoA-carboxylase] ligase n=1 Tax=Alkalibacterium sp. f15 TaxID=3414029 RepID=UPI003BF799E6